jgi:hypothetical protein
MCAPVSLPSRSGDFVTSPHVQMEKQVEFQPGSVPQSLLQLHALPVSCTPSPQFDF